MIRGFDGVRGIAALLVIVTHLHLLSMLEARGYLWPPLRQLFSGTTAVQAFFILSGFLITKLLIQEKQSTGRIAIGRFVMRRTLRIFPLYFLACLLTTLLAFSLDFVATGKALLYSFLYVSNFIGTADYSIVLGHTWSLAVEEHFYLIWPIVFSLAYAVRKTRALELGLLLFAAASLVLHYLLLKSDLANHYFVDRWSFIAGYNIALGCLAALFVARLPRPPSARATQLLALAGIGALLVSIALPAGSWFLQNVVSVYVRALGLLCLIVWIYCRQDSKVVTLLETPALKYLGKISYGLYMWQGLFLGTGPERLPGQVWPPDPWIGALLTALVAPLSYRYFEQPFLRLKHRYDVARGVPSATAKAAATERVG